MKARRTGYDRTVLAMNDEDAASVGDGSGRCRVGCPPGCGGGDWGAVIPEAAEQSPKDSEIERVMAAWKRMRRRPMSARSRWTSIRS
jgi:hypothetical protein